MTARKPLVVVNNTAGDLASGDTLDAVACFGYQPARPSLVAQATAASLSGIGVGASSPSILASVSFVATALNVEVSGAASFAATTSGGAETVVAYCSLYNTDSGSIVVKGPGETVDLFYGNGNRQLGGSAVYSGLNIGQHYTAYFYAYQTDGSCAVSVTAPFVRALNF